MWAPLPMVPWVFLALAPAPRVLAQVQLAASGPGAGRVSESVTLSCAVSGVSITDPSYSWNWIRQRPGAGLESLGWIYPSDGRTGYAPAFQDRVNISADPVGNRVSLQLRSLSAADAATYYCAAHSDTGTRSPRTEREGPLGPTSGAGPAGPVPAASAFCWSSPS